jgi:hypothetical protein
MVTAFDFLVNQNGRHQESPYAAKSKVLLKGQQWTMM